MEIATTILGALLVLSLLAHVFLWEVRNDLERRLEEALEQRDRARDERDQAREERDERTGTFFKRLEQLARLVPDLERYASQVGPSEDVVLNPRAIDRDIEALETAERMKRAAELRPNEPGGAVFKDCHWGFDPAHDGPIGVFYFETEAVKEARRQTPEPLFFVSYALVPGSKKKTQFGLATVVGPKAGALEGLRGTIVVSPFWDSALTPKQRDKARGALRRNRAKGARVIWPNGKDVTL